MRLGVVTQHSLGLSRDSLWIRLGISAALVLAVIWVTAGLVVHRHYSDAIRSANERVIGKSKTFAQYTISTVRRVDQIAREASAAYERNPADFRRFIVRQSDLVRDIAFQVAVLDRNGFVRFSSIDPAVGKVDLSAREHFRVHKESGGLDQLFISRPVVGKVSKKWAIQFTRPLYNDFEFDGVVVISVDPAEFAAFGQDLDLGPGGIASISRNTGERMARYPIDESQYGLQMPDPLPIWAADLPTSGSFEWRTTSDGVERIYGYTRLPRFGMTVLVGETMKSALAHHYTFRTGVVLFAVFATVFFAVILFLVSRWVKEKMKRDEGWRHANTDPLTGLANRRGFLEEIQNAVETSRRDQSKFALLFIDIDHFKPINDSLGHQVGDSLLSAISKRVKNSVREDDTVARIGGDEFTVILRNISDFADVDGICKKLLNCISLPMRDTEHTLHVTGSIGVAVYPDDALDSDGLIAAADQAMYVSKQQGRNRFTAFSKNLD